MLAISLDSSHDLHLVGGDLATVTDAAAVAQRVKQHLKFWHGEWFLDRTAGVQWVEFVFVRPFDQGIAEAVLKEAVLGVLGVASIESFDVEFQPERRGWIIHEMQLRTTFDETVTLNG
jgi:hypothetical protein